MTDVHVENHANGTYRVIVDVDGCVSGFALEPQPLKVGDKVRRKRYGGTLVGKLLAIRGAWAWVQWEGEPMSVLLDHLESVEPPPFRAGERVRTRDQNVMIVLAIFDGRAWCRSCTNPDRFDTRYVSDLVR